ncbi:MAG: thioredoxin family protein [Phenylobacterium sp.]|jgi:peroxiredoxin|uniref:thioredoxin family protein n=1 Tax=Phenylobacterium sp. TaxID=1871053 RepID=UPI002A31B28A|nr:thioredoxin family protein [Phenylobacterium sp.]MDD3837356.1 thioredoxin family protein [Phenylobacterium sp.]MDX9997787.1 thioredoxin family protein [Phenylobacterium sp.]
MIPLTRRLVLAACAATLTAPAAAVAAPAIGQPAPVFRAVDADGRTRSLDEFKGKTVVLEWHNGGCPYVQKYYNAGAMQSLQRQATADGVVWLTLVSSGPGTQGHLTPAEAKSWKAANKAGSTALLLDPDGKVGKAYDARTTPHMYVVDKTGRLVYMGGIDDKPAADPASLKGAKNYVAAALADLKAGRAVATPVTRPYGCSVKYKG